MNNKKKIVYLAIFLAILIICVLILNKKIEAETCFAENTVDLPVVMYHHLSEKSSILGEYTLSVEQFENDLKYIKELGYEPISANQLLMYVYDNGELPKKPIMITFDDGHESFYKYAYPLLKKYKMKGIVSVVGNFTDTYTANEDHNIDYSYLNWEQVNELANSGFVEIGNHSYNMHKIQNGRKGVAKKKGESLETYKNIIGEDILKLQEEIHMYTGIKSNIFAYPFGSFSKESKGILNEMGFDIMFTCAEKLNKISKNNSVLSLGRFNRPNGKNSSTFFEKILVK